MGKGCQAASPLGLSSISCGSAWMLQLPCRFLIGVIGWSCQLTYIVDTHAAASTKQTLTMRNEMKYFQITPSHHAQ